MLIFHDITPKSLALKDFEVILLVSKKKRGGGCLG
jgi:hypothetical protein